MSKKDVTFQYCDEIIDQFEKVCKHPIVEKSSVYYAGVDLGTACIVVAVLDENRRPVAGRYQYADVVRDGLVEELLYAAAAIPPGTDTLDGGAVKNVIQGAGFEITNLLDESTAANAVLRIKNGAIVDIGGGTTGISIFKDGEVVYVADEPTGGTHFSLVLAGALHIPFEEAELKKRDPAHHKEILPVLKPVVEKVAAIVKQHIQGYNVDEIYLVGGTCCLTGIEGIIQKQTGIPTFKPKNPMFATPLGIALNCKQEVMD